MGTTAELSRFAAEIALDRLPPAVVQRTRFLLLDLIGNIVRACHDAESTPALLAAVRALGSEAQAVLDGDNAEKLITNLRERRKIRNT